MDGSSRSESNNEGWMDTCCYDYKERMMEGGKAGTGMSIPHGTTNCICLIRIYNET